MSPLQAAQSADIRKEAWASEVRTDLKTAATVGHAALAQRVGTNRAGIVVAGVRLLLNSPLGMGGPHQPDSSWCRPFTDQVEAYDAAVPGKGRANAQALPSDSTGNGAFLATEALIRQKGCPARERLPTAVVSHPRQTVAAVDALRFTLQMQ